MNFSTFIPMTPVAKARARVTRFVTYTPEKTKNAESFIKMDLRCKYPPVLQGPLILELTFSFKKPKSAPKSRHYPTVKPDLDNLVKLVKDACNGILWTDDAQIVSLRAQKRYGDLAGIYLKVEEEIS